MKKERVIEKFHIRAITLLIFSIIFAVMGFYKILVYENAEYSWEENKNSYVGGDAYNYIINGTYFAGYCALSGACLIGACISSSAGLKIKSDLEEETEKVQSRQDQVDPIFKNKQNQETELQPHSGTSAKAEALSALKKLPEKTLFERRAFLEGQLAYPAITKLTPKEQNAIKYEIACIDEVLGEIQEH